MTAMAALAASMVVTVVVVVERPSPLQCPMQTTTAVLTSAPPSLASSTCEGDSIM